MDIFTYIFYVLLIFVIGELVTYCSLTYFDEKYEFKIGHTIIGHLSLFWPVFLLGVIIVGFLMLLMVPVMVMHIIIKKLKK